MTIYKNIARVVVEFTDREGVPSALIVEDLPSEAYAEISVSDDGLSFDTLVLSQGQDNKSGAFHFKALESWELKYVRRAGQDGQGVANKAEFGRTGKIIMTIVSLAILVPFIGILWAWAGGVFRSLGGLG